MTLKLYKLADNLADQCNPLARVRRSPTEPAVLSCTWPGMSVKGSTPDISETCSDKSFQKTVTLQKDYGKTGALKTEDGTLYIGTQAHLGKI